ncbi:MAG: RIP metalloprotease RseP [Bacteroidales bacterium]|nr:RIP metalloprotease RseP [Bacteroidales bacterium]
MGIGMQVLGLIASLSLLVFVHELGHYFFARIFHTRVDKFYLFFNPGFSIMRMKKCGDQYRFSFFSSDSPEDWKNYPENTEWGIGWLPLGGYCSINGMVDETTKADQLSAEPQPWEFRAKPAWQRLFIIIGGVLMNFITALIIYVGVMYHYGNEYVPVTEATYGLQFTESAKNIGFQNGDKIISVDGKVPETMGEFATSLLIDDVKEVKVNRDGEIVSISIPDNFGQQVLAAGDNAGFCQFNFPFVVDIVMEDHPAEAAGLQHGDSLVAINGEEYFSFYDYQSTLSQNKNKDVELSFYRGDSLYQATVHLTEEGVIGVYPVNPAVYLTTKVIKYGFFESIPVGIKKGFETLATYVKQFKLVFTKEGAQQLGGFGTIGSIFPKVWDWERFWNMTAFLGIILAFMNIIPIPALDGGYLLFIIVEMITRRKPSDKFIGIANTIGFTLLIILLIYANGMDIIRAFFK